MSSDIMIVASKRDTTGKKVKDLRDSGEVPAVLYSKGKESINLKVPYMALYKAYSAAGYGQPVEIELEGKTYLTMIKDAHMDPVKHRLVHVAFHAVDANKVVEAEVSIHIEGDVPAEQTGNFIVRPNDHVTIEAKPADLPEFIAITAEKLVQPGDQLTAADLTMPAKVTLMSDPATVLAVVEEPRVQEEPEATEEVDAADVPSAHGGEAGEEVTS